MEQRLLQEGMTEAQMLEAQADLGSRMAPSSEQALLAIYHGQQEHAWRRTFVEVVEGRWSVPACTAGCTVHRRSASSTSPGTRS